MPLHATRAAGRFRAAYNVASSRQVGADGALKTGVDEWYMPIPGTGRARLAAAQSFCWLLLTQELLWHADIHAHRQVI